MANPSSTLLIFPLSLTFSLMEKVRLRSLCDNFRFDEAPSIRKRVWVRGNADFEHQNIW